MHVYRGLLAVCVAGLVAVAAVLPVTSTAGMVHGATMVNKKTNCKTVKKHGHKTKVCAKAQTAARKPTATPEPIVITSVTFYSSGSHASCDPSGQSGTSFPNTAAEVYAVAEISGWHGQHTIAVEAYSPDGNRASTTQSQATDVGSNCSWLPIANTQWAQMLGAWTFRYYIDGSQATSATFTLTYVAPSPTSTAVPRIQESHDSQKGTDAIYDVYTDVGAGAGAYEYGSTDQVGLRAPTGYIYFWALGLEKNFSAVQYSSNPLNFKLTGSDGSVYTWTYGAPADKAGQPMGAADLNQSESNSGWLEFKVPNQADTYTISWNESYKIPFTPFGRIRVTPGSSIQVLSLSAPSRAGSRVMNLTKLIRSRVLG